MSSPGQFVVGSFFASDNTCEMRSRLPTSCVRREAVGAGGAQAELLRVPLADGTLVATPDIPPPDLVPSFLAASDVLGTGWFGAVAADVRPGKTVVVVGDGAVGLLGVLAAKQLGAERIVAMSRHQDRQKLALDYGATEIVEERGDDGVARMKADRRTRRPFGDRGRRHAGGHGPGDRGDAAGGHVAYVGVPHDVTLSADDLFSSLHIHLHGGPARSGSSCRSSSSSSGSERSTLAGCSTSSSRSMRRRRATGRWTNAEPSRSCSACDPHFQPAPTSRTTLPSGP